MITLQAKLMALFFSVIFLMVSCMGTYFVGRHDGKAMESARYAALESARSTKVATKAVNHTSAVVAAVVKDQSIERKSNEEYEKAVLELQRYRAANRDLVAERGGLRIAASACARSDRTGASTQTTSTSGSDDSFAGTIALPKEVDEDLQSAADESDIYLEKLRTAQKWIIAQGFYDPIK